MAREGLLAEASLCKHGGTLRTHGAGVCGDGDADPGGWWLWLVAVAVAVAA